VKHSRSPALIPGKYVPAAIFLVVTMYIFFPLWLKPNAHIFGYNVDGIKTYYAAAWHIEHGGGDHFTGMGWPGGEKLVYTDNKPAVACTLHALNRLLPADLSRYTIGIYNLLMIAGFFLGLLLMYHFLRITGTGTVLAVAGSIIIIGLSNTFYRMEGHYALAYTFFVPGLFLLLLSTLRKPGRLFYPVLLSVFILVFTFIHFYYLLLAALFTASVIIYVLLTRSWPLADSGDCGTVGGFQVARAPGHTVLDLPYGG
jgi:hypothetical protein